MAKVLVCVVAITMLASCGRKQERIDTGAIVPAAEMPGFAPDKSYAVVNSAWLPIFYKKWKADLWAKGVTKWEERFDCNRFAASYAAAAQIEYYLAKFHAWEAGQALAVGEVWFKQDRGGAHAIVCVLTERGMIYIEPQNGQELALTETELRSVYFRRW